MCATLERCLEPKEWPKNRWHAEQVGAARPTGQPLLWRFSSIFFFSFFLCSLCSLVFASPSSRPKVGLLVTMSLGRTQARARMTLSHGLAISDQIWSQLGGAAVDLRSAGGWLAGWLADGEPAARRPLRGHYPARRDASAEPAPQGGGDSRAPLSVWDNSLSFFSFFAPIFARAPCRQAHIVAVVCYYVSPVWRGRPAVSVSAACVDSSNVCLVRLLPRIACEGRSTMDLSAHN